MTINARAFASRGLGFGPRLMAAHGLGSVVVIPLDPPSPAAGFMPRRRPKPRRTDIDDDVLLFLLR